MTDGQTGDHGGRFRRPDWKSPSPEGDRGEEASGERLPSVDPERQARELGHALEPLKQLASAFRENSETLRALAEGQARLGRRMERSDRSEAVIQSTKALNDTFRGVQRTQERLMGRLEKEKKRPFLLLGLVVLLVGCLVGGILWFLLGWVGEREDASRDGQRTEWSAALERSAARGDDLAGEIAGLREDLVRESRATEAAAERAEILRAEVAEREERIAALTETIGNMKEAQAGISMLNRTNATLSSENARLERDLAEIRSRVREFEDALAERDSEIARQASRIEDLVRRAAGAPAAAEAGEAAEPVVGPEEEAGVPREIPDGAARDPAELARLTSILNRLLLDSRGADSWRIRKIGGIRGKILYDVVMVNLEESGAEAKRIEAGECRLVVDQVQRRAEFRFRNGHLVYYGVRAPFWGGTYVVPIVNIDPDAWLRSGLTVMDEVR